MGMLERVRAVWGSGIVRGTALVAVGAAVAILVIGWGTAASTPADFAIEALSAVATLAAVIVALVVADRQIAAAKEAAQTERDTMLQLQANELDQRRREDRARAVRLAHAFSRELIFASRDLKVLLANLRPERFVEFNADAAEFFVDPKPLPDLTLIERFADRLEGFDDADAFAITTLLASWQNYNRGPGVNVSGFAQIGADRRVRLATNRVDVGMVLLTHLETLIGTVANYYADHPAMEGTVYEETPSELVELMKHAARRG